MFGANTVAAPAAAPILSTFLLLIVPSVFFRSFAFFLGIEVSFQPFGWPLTKESFAGGYDLTLDRAMKLSILGPTSRKGYKFEGEGFVETVE
jgi:hypothetical protein